MSCTAKHLPFSNKSLSWSVIIGYKLGLKHLALMINRRYHIIEKLLTDILRGYDTIEALEEILVRNQQISIGKYQIQKALVIFDCVENQS